MKQLFECDPAKNTGCSKTNYYLNGGDCRLTHHAEFTKELPSMNDIKNMFDLQRKLQERLGTDFEKIDDAERADFMRNHYVFLDQELQEALREVPYFKQWKDYSHMTATEKEAAWARVRMELVDAWHFMMNLMLMSGMTPEALVAMYLAKNKENHRRQDAGYTHDVDYSNQSVEEVMGNE